MDAPNIIEILKKWNPWEISINAGIKRQEYITKIYTYFDRKEVIVLKGIRRSGKSTILKQLMLELIAHGIDKKHILYLNLEDYNFANNLDVPFLEDVLVAYKDWSKNKRKIYLFIDEIQKIDSWEKWIRTKYDLQENIKFIITGSSASLLSKELSTLLTGRNISFKIFPLSFLEYLAFAKKSSLQEYLTYGGFPEVVLEKSNDKKMVLLRQYFEDIIHKDIVDRYNIRNAKQLIEIARYFVSTSGSKISLNKLSKVFGISKDTIAHYVAYMIDAFLVYEVTYFSYSAKIRHDVTKLPKLYALDNGLINVVNIRFSQGQMYENAVLVKLVTLHDSISYWSSLKSEVDFIVDSKAINVTSSSCIPEREREGLSEFFNIHKNFSLVLICSKSGKDTVSLMDFIKR